ncbi:MAG: HAD-IIIA family hydrolase [Phycisphaeraceae bacterium]|nr:MAG: HAD-IIIA family hydrolase [Phycisphaeraceae bacterium]
MPNDPDTARETPGVGQRRASRPAVFLDRDETIIPNRAVTECTATPGDLYDPSLVRLLPGAGEALGELSRAGWPLVVVTNQGGLSHGLGTIEQVHAVNARMADLLRPFDAALAGVYLAPFRPGATFGRYASDPDRLRKPGPGMLLAAARDLGLDLPGSWMVGDAERDVEAGIAAGLDPSRCLRVGTPAIPDLAAAASIILRSGPPAEIVGGGGGGGTPRIE